MSHLERGLEWARTLINGSNTWDYCVVWRIADESSRCIELVDCCCSGGASQQRAIKRVKTEQNVTIPLCRDEFHVHPANTNSCEALAILPDSYPLYHGLHGEVVISGQPKWLKICKRSASSTSDEDVIQTLVLIPVLGGLIELFSANHMPDDQRIIDLVKAHFTTCPETEAMSTSTISFDGHFINPSLNQANILPSTQMPAVHPYSHPNVDGSSTSSLPSDEHTSPDSNPCSVSQSLPLNKDGPTGRQHGKSKNLLTERRRRNRINEGILTLRSLVPNITKMNRAATLGDAIDYIQALENQIEELKLELNTFEEGDCNKILSELTAPKLDREVRERPNLGVQVVEAYQLGTGKFLLKIKCQKIPGAFTELLEALDSSGLHTNDVKDVNVTTCNTLMWSNLTIQTNRKDIQLKDLMESMSSLTC